MSDYTIPKTAAVQRLITYRNLGNVQIINAINPYKGKSELTPNYTKDEPVGVSSLGTPIYTDLTLQGGFSYTDNITGKTIEIADDIYLETVIMMVSVPKRIITTEIQGRDGTVKEYIGANDAIININGIITGRNGVYPRDQVRALKEWIDAPVAKGIVAWWLDNLGISQIVVTDASFPQTQGGYSYQVFSIDAISDIPVELKIFMNV